MASPRRPDLSPDTDHEFLDRAHEHLRIASEQMTGVPHGQVSASMMYACARFNAWLSASHRESAKDLKSAYGETIEYFVAQYRKMLVKNLDDFVANFGEYMQPPADKNS
jgi:Protein of unknown function (DUF3144)